jgi:hypothetical protein
MRLVTDTGGTTVYHDDTIFVQELERNNAVVNEIEKRDSDMVDSKVLKVSI